MCNLIENVLEITNEIDCRATTQDSKLYLNGSDVSAFIRETEGLREGGREKEAERGREGVRERERASERARG